MTSDGVVARIEIAEAVAHSNAVSKNIVPRKAPNRASASAGVTLRHLLGMTSGVAYTRTNGHAWHDLHSDDARFFYSRDFERALQLLKSMASEDERERAAVYMDGLSQMRSDWASKVGKRKTKQRSGNRQ